MHHTKMKLITTLTFAIFLSSLTTSTTASAQDTKLQLSPVKIEGFQYRYIAKAKLHMNVCKKPACGRGSKVSYIFLRKVDQPNFQTFSNNRKRIANILRQRTPAGTSLEFSKPKVRKNAVITVFSQMRKATNANGQVHYTMSTVVHTPINSISLISSSPIKKHAQANRSKFGVALTKMIRANLGLPATN